MLPPAPNLPFTSLGTRPVKTKEWPAGDIQEELRTIFTHGLPERIKNSLVGPLGVGTSLHHQRRNGADKDSFFETICAVLPQIMGNLSSSMGVTNHNGILDFQVRKKLFEVVNKGIHIVSVPGLSRSPMAAPIVRDGTVAVFC